MEGKGEGEQLRGRRKELKEGLGMGRKKKEGRIELPVRVQNPVPSEPGMTALASQNTSVLATIPTKIKKPAHNYKMHNLITCACQLEH